MDPFEGTCMKIHLYWASTFFKLPLFSIADGACSTMVWLQVCGSYHMYTCMSLLKCETKERSIINANISMYKPGLYKGTSKAQGCKYDFFFLLIWTICFASNSAKCIPLSDSLCWLIESRSWFFHSFWKLNYALAMSEESLFYYRYS